MAKKSISSQEYIEKSKMYKNIWELQKKELFIYN